MEQNRAATIELFEYPDFPAPEPPSLEAFGAPAESQPSPTQSAPTSVEFLHAACQRQLAEEKQRSFEAGRIHGIEEGARAERESARAAQVAGEEQSRSRIAAALAQIDREREDYMQAVEQEVVDLALAVAARILRREAQMDPLLLTGAVRVALGQLTRTTAARLKVPETEAALWSETVTHLPNLIVQPVVVPVPGMLAGECELETALGSVDLGLRAQLAEIERGFFDRTIQPRTIESDESRDGTFAAQMRQP